MSSAKIERFLEEHGWTRALAGNADFDAALAAVDTMIREESGLIVSGEYGVGKTALVQALLAGFAETFRVRIALADEIERLSQSWHEYWGVNPYAVNVFLDDLAAESPVNEFGVRRESAADFIVAYHTLHAPGTRLFVTTNLTTKELDTRYGGRVLSRLKDLCVPLRLTGADKRTWSRTQKTV